MSHRKFALAFALILSISSNAYSATFETTVLWGPRESIIMRGVIDHGDDEKFRQVVLGRLNQGRLIDDVRLFSPGGDVDAAIGIGKQISVLGIATRAPQRAPNGSNSCFTGGVGSPRQETGSSCTCESACSLIWMSGGPRIGNVVGIHAPRYDEAFFRSLSADEAEAQYKVVVQKIKEYLQPFDLPDFVQREMYQSSSQQMHFLSDSEIYQLRNVDEGRNEYGIAKCGAYPSSGGDIHTNPAIKKWADCDYPLEEAHDRKGAQRYLQVYGVSR
jgi:hypothetical protein